MDVARPGIADLVVEGGSGALEDADNDGAGETCCASACGKPIKTTSSSSSHEPCGLPIVATTTIFIATSNLLYRIMKASVVDTGRSDSRLTVHREVVRDLCLAQLALQRVMR